MDFSSVFSYQTLLLSLSVYAVVSVLRSASELVFRILNRVSYRDSLAWRELVLPALSIIIGGLLGGLGALLPEAIAASSLISRVSFGCVCGLFSSYVFNRAKSFVGAVREKTS